MILLRKRGSPAENACADRFAPISCHTLVQILRKEYVFFMILKKREGGLSALPFGFYVFCMNRL
jgi:hypothetical protein